jgi:hypothetical protein
MDLGLCNKVQRLWKRDSWNGARRMIPVQKKADFEIDFLTEEARNTDGKLISKEDAIFIADWITRDYS